MVAKLGPYNQPFLLSVSDRIPTRKKKQQLFTNYSSGYTEDKYAIKHLYVEEAEYYFCIEPMPLACATAQQHAPSHRTAKVGNRVGDSESV